MWGFEAIHMEKEQLPTFRHREKEREGVVILVQKKAVLAKFRNLKFLCARRSNFSVISVRKDVPTQTQAETKFK